MIADLGLILAGAGAGSRFGSGRNKLLVDLCGRPVFLHSLARFLQVVPAVQARVMAPAGLAGEFRAAMDAAGIGREVAVLEGGATRWESVLRGLRSLPEAVRFVAIQDAARPLSSLELLLDCLASARARGSGVAARPVADTIKLVGPDGRVRQTPDRGSLRAAETPQVFAREPLLEAYREVEASSVPVTDDAQALERRGLPVYLVEHRQYNPKITWPQDVALVECYLESIS